MRQQKGEAGFARTVIARNTEGPLAGFVVQAFGDPFEAKARLSSNDVTPKSGWIAKIAFQLSRTEKAPLDIQKL